MSTNGTPPHRPSAVLAIAQAIEALGKLMILGALLIVFGFIAYAILVH